jgi:hypothetical protein
MSSKRQFGKPVHVIAHFLPVDVLREVHALAKRMQRDEVCRRYLQRNIVFVLPASAFITLGLFFLTVKAMLIVTGLFDQPITRSVAIFTFVGGAVTWIAATIGALYLFFSYLEKEALRADEPNLR